MRIIPITEPMYYVLVHIGRIKTMAQNFVSSSLRVLDYCAFDWSPTEHNINECWKGERCDNRWLNKNKHKNPRHVCVRIMCSNFIWKRLFRRQVFTFAFANEYVYGPPGRERERNTLELQTNLNELDELWYTALGEMRWILMNRTHPHTHTQTTTINSISNFQPGIDWIDFHWWQLYSTPRIISVLCSMHVQ